MGREPARLLLVGALRAVVRHAVEQARLQFHRPELTLRGRLRLDDLYDRARDLLALRGEPRPQFLEPVAEAQGGDAIVAVVLLHDAPHLFDGGARLWVGRRFVDAARFEQALQRVAVVVRGVEFGLPRVAVELLQVLDGVALDACADGLPRRRVEVDEEFGAEHIVHFVLAGRVAAHQPLERARLVGSEVVDMQVGELLAPRLDEVNELLENDALARRETARRGVLAERPSRVILRLSVRADHCPSEQILEALRSDERRAFDVEEDVAGRGLRQARKAAPRLAGPQFVVWLVPDAPLELDARLLAGALVGGGRSALGLAPQRERLLGERLKPSDAPALYFAALADREAGDEREVVVFAAPRRAVQPPPADVAVGDGLRVGCDFA